MVCHDSPASGPRNLLNVLGSNRIADRGIRLSSSASHVVPLRGIRDHQSVPEIVDRDAVACSRSG